MVLGTIFGSFGGSIQTSKLGRRHGIMIDCCTNLGAVSMLALAPNFGMVLAARFIQGYSVGSGRVAIPIYTRYVFQIQKLYNLIILDINHFECCKIRFCKYYLSKHIVFFVVG